MAKDVIIACDFDSKEKTLAFLDRFTDVKPFVKIGMELFYAEGPQIVREIKARGHKIFLDLKLHDIPNTVRKAMKVLSELDVGTQRSSTQNIFTFFQSRSAQPFESIARKSFSALPPPDKAKLKNLLRLFESMSSRSSAISPKHSDCVLL